ncbi:MAG: riboflavin kinase, partial [Candidatus Caldatribacteriaceae bacterium]
VTFYPHPQNFLAGKRNEPLKYLTSYGEKYCLLQHFFPKTTLRFIRFNQKMRMTSPWKFLELLSSQLMPHLIFVGENFRFGYQAKGEISLLKKYFENQNIRVVAIPSIQNQGECISSSLIRTLLLSGDLQRVNNLLGYHFTIIGKVRKGKGLGGKLGFPTANLYPPSIKILPPHGVYISHVSWKNHNTSIPALTYIGHRPTFKNSSRKVVETFIPSYNSLDLYGQRIELRLAVFLREEKTFASPQDLKKQIDLDLEAFRQYLQGKNSMVNYPLNAILEV